MDYTSIFNNFSYNKENKVPYYIQLSEFIKYSIQNNTLNFIPSERELSSFLSVSRLTVSKAYEKLKKDGILYSKKGSGYFINKDSILFLSSKKTKAFFLINQLIDNLLKEDFSFNDIKNFFNSILSYQEIKSENINIAFIDCNPESYFIIKNQIKKLFKINSHFLPISSLLRNHNNRSILDKISGFDIVLTTKKHYNEIKNHLKNLVTGKDKNDFKRIDNLKFFDEFKLIKVHIEPDPDTLIKIAKIQKNSKKLVICYSKRFAIIVKEYLEKINDLSNTEYLILESLYKTNKGNLFENTIDINQEDKIERLVKNKLEEIDYLIIPAEFKVLEYKDYIYQNFKIDSFNENLLILFERLQKIYSDKIISFNYKVDNGSLILIEDKINEINSKRLKEYIEKGVIDEEN